MGKLSLHTKCLMNLYRDEVNYNVMIDELVKAGEVDKARNLFDERPERDAVSWSALLAGYSKMNRCKEVVELFDHMVAFQVKFDSVALVSMLLACAQLGEIEKGKMVHVLLGRKGKNRFILTTWELACWLCMQNVAALAIEVAMEVFKSCDKKNVPLWNAMLIGLVMHVRENLLLLSTQEWQKLV